MTEPKVEAGDRALETARKLTAISRLQLGLTEVDVPTIAALIQSAMNAQERERQKTIDFLDDELGRSVAETKQFAEALRDALYVMNSRPQQGWDKWRNAVAEAERLLAERGGTQ